MMSKERDAARITGAFAVSRLSSALLRDVVTPELLERFQLSGQRTLQLSDRLSIDLDEFNAAIASAASHGSASLSIKDGSDSVTGSVSLADAGAVVLEAPGYKWRIAHAVLLTMDATRRRELVSQVLQRHTLQSKVREEILRTIEKESLTNEELLDALESLNASPESFAQQLGALLQGGKTSVSDFLPPDSSYWGNITARCEESKTLAAFATHELAEERAARIREDARRGFLTVAYGFAATELVPFEWLRTLDIDVIVQGIEGVVTGTDDAYALVGAFEICADAISRDERLSTLGERILEKLFAEPQRLIRRCKFLSAIFVIASAQLAVHVETKEMPAFWRRLAAAAHAGWVMEACGSAKVDESKFLRWIMGERGQEYMLSSFHDMREQPRWQPEWIDAEFLVPDIFGRAFAAVAKVADGAPSTWRECLERMKSWIGEQAWDARTGLPSVLQGSREREMPQPEGELAGQMRAAFDEFSRAPTLDGLLELTGWIEFFGLGAEAIPGAKLVLHQLRTNADKSLEGKKLAAITVCTRLAVLSGDHEFAQAIADTDLERFRAEDAYRSITQLVFQLVECAAADLDHSRGLDTLANRLTSLGILLPPGDACSTLLVLLEILQKIDSHLAPRLARAVHGVRSAMAAPQFA
jgi:hypothetical protein